MLRCGKVKPSTSSQVHWVAQNQSVLNGPFSIGQLLLHPPSSYLYCVIELWTFRLHFSLNKLLLVNNLRPLKTASLRYKSLLVGLFFETDVFFLCWWIPICIGFENKTKESTSPFRRGLAPAVSGFAWRSIEIISGKLEN